MSHLPSLHSHHRFLVNSSCTGKTKLLFEGLCQHWGLYLPSDIDTNYLGAYDLPNLYDNFKGEFLSSCTGPEESNYALERNRQSARRAFQELLLARLLVLKFYATIMCENGPPTEQHKLRWLLVQLRPSDVSQRRDIFRHLSRYFDHVTDTYINETIHATLTEIYALCGIGSEGTGLFVAFDECSNAVRQGTYYFRDEGGAYPIFKEFIRTCRSYTADFNVTVVAAGRSIPKEFFEYEVGEWDSVRWISDTSALDDEQSHNQFVSQFFPPSYLNSDSGKCLVRRMWRWLRGR